MTEVGERRKDISVGWNHVAKKLFSKDIGMRVILSYFKWAILVIITGFLLVTIYVHNEQPKITYQYKDDSMFDVEIGVKVKRYEQIINQLNKSTKQQILLAEAKQNLDISSRYLESNEYVSALRCLNELIYYIELAKLKDAHPNGLNDKNLDLYKQEVNKWINEDTKTRERINSNSIYGFEWYFYSKYMNWRASNQLNLASENIELGRNDEALDNIARAISDSNIALLGVTLTKKRGVMGEGFVNKYLQHLLENESEKTFNNVIEKIGGLDDVNKINALNKLYTPNLGYMCLFNERVVLAEVNAYYMLKNTNQNISEIKTQLEEEINIANEEISECGEVHTDMVFSSMLLDLAKISLDSGSTKEDFTLGLSYAQEARKFIRVWNNIINEWYSNRDLKTPKKADFKINCESLDYCTVTITGIFDSKRPNLNLSYRLYDVQDYDLSVTLNEIPISHLTKDNYVEINTKLEEDSNVVKWEYLQPIKPTAKIIFFSLSNPFNDFLYPFTGYELEFTPKRPYTTDTKFKITIPQGYVLSEKSGEYVLIMGETHKTKNLEQLSIKDNSYILLTKTFHPYDGKRVIVSFQHANTDYQFIFFVVLLLSFLIGFVGLDNYSRKHKLNSGKLSVNQKEVISGLIFSIGINLLQILVLNPPLISLMTLSPFIGIFIGGFTFYFTQKYKKSKR